MQKRGVLEQILAPEMAKTAKIAHFGPFSVIFVGFLGNEPHAQSDLAMGSQRRFWGTWDLSDQKTPSGSHGLGYLDVGGIFEAVKR